MSTISPLEITFSATLGNTDGDDVTIHLTERLG